MKICYGCKREKDKSEFGSNGAGRLKPRCRQCHHVYELATFNEKVVRVMGGESNMKCTKCGYNKCLNALEFHHTNPLEKNRAVAVMKNYSFVKIKEEIEKCVLLCANCHREVHANNQKA